MPEQLKKVTDPVIVRWVALTRPQQYKLVGITLAVLIALALTLFLTFRTRYEVLVAGRDAMETGQMSAALDEEGIRNRVIHAGRGLEVDTRRMNDARAVIIAQNVRPQDETFTWADAFDAAGLSTTESQRRTMAILATAGDIEEQMLRIDGIQSANVTLNVPEPTRVFRRDVPQASASATLFTTRDIPPHEGRNLALVIANSVQGLDLENVHIIDQHARTIFSADMEMSQDPIGTARAAQQQHTNSVQLSLSRMLLSTFDEVEPIVRFSFDNSLFTEEVATIFTTPAGQDGGIAFHTRDRRAEMEGGAGGMPPGLDPNNATFPNYAMPGNDGMSASQRESETQYHINRIESINQTGPGWVIPAQSSVAVTAVIWQDIFQDLWMDEEDGRDEAAWRRFKNENARPRLINGDAYFDLDSIHGLVESATGVPRTQNMILIYEVFNFIDDEQRPLDIPLLVMLGVLLLLLLMLAYSLLKRQRAADEEEEGMEPELSVEDLLVSTQLEEAKEEAVEHLEEIDYFKENEVKKNIEKFVNEKPEAVAALLRNWLNLEEW